MMIPPRYEKMTDWLVAIAFGILFGYMFFSGV